MIMALEMVMRNVGYAADSDIRKDTVSDAGWAQSWLEEVIEHANR